MDKTVRRVNAALRTLSVSQILAGTAALGAILLFVSHEILEMVGEDIMMSGKSIELAAYLVMVTVVVAGVVSFFRLKWGWILSFTVATFVLVMALLMGPGTITVTKWSFLGLMVLSLVNWAAAVVHYFHDLYT